MLLFRARSRNWISLAQLMPPSAVEDTLMSKLAGLAVMLGTMPMLGYAAAMLQSATSIRGFPLKCGSCKR